MCLALYLAAATPLSIVPWDPAKPAFHVVELPEDAAFVRKLLRYEHVYYVGSHQGCSCAFNYEHEFNSVLELRDYLRQALSLTNEIEGFACRADREKKNILHVVTTSPEGIALPEFLFQDGQRLLIRSPGSMRAQRRPAPRGRKRGTKPIRVVAGGLK